MQVLMCTRVYTLSRSLLLFELVKSIEEQPTAHQPTEERPTVKSRVGVRQLRSGLSSYVARASAGETIVVTVDGEPRARLAPLERDGASSLEALARSGGIGRPGANGSSTPSLDRPRRGRHLPAGPAIGIDTTRLLARIRG